MTTAAEKSIARGGEFNAVNVHFGEIGSSMDLGLGGNLDGNQGEAPVSTDSSIELRAGLPDPEIVGRACNLRPGDPGFEECEACQ